MLLYLVVLASIALWIIAANRLNNFGGSDGMKTFYKHIFVFIGIGFLLYFIIVYPVLDCKGFLCGLGPILSYIIIMGLAGVIWPIVLIAMSPKLWIDKPKEEQDEIID